MVLKYAYRISRKQDTKRYVLGSIKEYRRILNKNRKEKLTDVQVKEAVKLIQMLATQSVKLYLNQENT